MNLAIMHNNKFFGNFHHFRITMELINQSSQFVKIFSYLKSMLKFHIYTCLNHLFKTFEKPKGGIK